MLQATHQFPCSYAVTVIAFNREAVTADVRRAVVVVLETAVDGPGDTTHETRASREGKYLSHRFAVPMRNAEEVLEMYARLRVVEGVVTIL